MSYLLISTRGQNWLCCLACNAHRYQWIFNEIVPLSSESIILNFVLIGKGIKFGKAEVWSHSKALPRYKILALKARQYLFRTIFFLVGPGQDMYGGPGTERNYVSICFGSKGTRQKLKISHLSANSCMFFQNIQLSIVFLWLHPVHLYF